MPKKNRKTKEPKMRSDEARSLADPAYRQRIVRPRKGKGAKPPPRRPTPDEFDS
jgi:stalled ribosome alternative rescue factor ArfA